MAGIRGAGIAGTEAPLVLAAETALFAKRRAARARLAAFGAYGSGFMAAARRCPGGEAASERDGEAHGGGGQRAGGGA